MDEMSAREYQDTFGKGKGKVPAGSRKKMQFPKKEEPGKKDIRTVLMLLQASGKIQGYDLEYRFHPMRRWRFDYAIPSMKIAIEYEGLHSLKSGHTTVKGYNKDLQKYNAATVLGWKVLRYSANTYTEFATDITEILNHGT
ncbi:MAG: hypothetical protein KDB14_35195 [Planctomycetales bacterium]|nr:hypothetical protein [Planctomycetales bacterium]